MQPGLLYGSLHVIAKPQVVDDGLQGEGNQEVSTALEQGQGKQGTGKVRPKTYTSAVDVVICVPPEAPTTICTLPSLSTMIDGHMDESGCFPVVHTGRRRGWSVVSQGTSPLPTQVFNPRIPTLHLA